jgi:3-oxoacyl-ACP reductase-like protein
VLAVTKQGGHCAFLQGMWPLGPSWSDAVLVEWVEALLAARLPRAEPLGPAAAAQASAALQKLQSKL